MAVIYVTFDTASNRFLSVSLDGGHYESVASVVLSGEGARIRDGEGNEVPSPFQPAEEAQLSKAQADIIAAYSGDENEDKQGLLQCQ